MSRTGKVELPARRRLAIAQGTRTGPGVAAGINPVKGCPCVVPEENPDRLLLERHACRGAAVFDSPCNR